MPSQNHGPNKGNSATRGPDLSIPELLNLYSGVLGNDDAGRNLTEQSPADNGDLAQSVMPQGPSSEPKAD